MLRRHVPQAAKLRECDNTVALPSQEKKFFSDNQAVSPCLLIRIGSTHTVMRDVSPLAKNLDRRPRGVAYNISSGLFTVKSHPDRCRRALGRPARRRARACPAA